ncbi:MAG: hypothetical protein IKR59_01515 [Lachnospiraceae bacterium]|nr:hypothetical protein [Lachnospiraceae bacterium]
MKTIRAFAVVLILCIAAVFTGMLVSLIRGNNNLFFILGAVLVGLVILGLVILKIAKNREEPDKEKEQEDRRG